MTKLIDVPYFILGVAVGALAAGAFAVAALGADR
jgi:hypothetical protein